MPHAIVYIIFFISLFLYISIAYVDIKALLSNWHT